MIQHWKNITGRNPKYYFILGFLTGLYKSGNLNFHEWQIYLPFCLLRKGKLWHVQVCLKGNAAFGISHYHNDKCAVCCLKMLCANVSEYVFPAHLLISILFTYWQEKDSKKDLQNKVCFNMVSSKANKSSYLLACLLEVVGMSYISWSEELRCVSANSSSNNTFFHLIQVLYLLSNSDLVHSLDKSTSPHSLIYHRKFSFCNNVIGW